jgi:putative addiction module component (TIGR02574 family)
MTRKAQALADEIATLSQKECAELATLLLQRLDGEKDDAFLVETEWTQEIERRIDDVESGKGKCIDGDEVLRRARNRKK